MVQLLVLENQCITTDNYSTWQDAACNTCLSVWWTV